MIEDKCHVCQLDFAEHPYVLPNTHRRQCLKYELKPELKEKVQELMEVATDKSLKEVMAVVPHFDLSCDQEMNLCAGTLVGPIHLETWLRKAGPREDCNICFERFKVEDMFTLDCLSSTHRFCWACMKYQVKINIEGGTTPQCPVPDCKRPLSELEVRQLFGVDNPILAKYEALNLNKHLTTAPDIIACPTPDCQNCLVASSPGQPEHCYCEGCKKSFCSCCKGPYHYRTSCVQSLEHQQNYIQWQEVHKREYYSKLGKEKADWENEKKEVLQRNKELKERAKEAEKDEEWKREHCKLCPSCGRTINYLEGCDLMRCGRDYHGGNVQNGCGASFRW
eukprot:CAMPEP_0174275770 /NCGR_PEP_ID=MMETSP0439-20130205/60011_1 /TAXON_ID=0 /ORGANISM="Stereomyxa ramosa, Strain Chinc5" /LENGTH=335 /DNA_ID=CAMNT_0015367917 /DNA_START=1107 /DNA_END=2111 /DNA_ORIENTATION=+